MAGIPPWATGATGDPPTARPRSGSSPAGQSCSTATLHPRHRRCNRRPSVRGTRVGPSFRRDPCASRTEGDVRNLARQHRRRIVSTSTAGSSTGTSLPAWARFRLSHCGPSTSTTSTRRSCSTAERKAAPSPRRHPRSPPDRPQRTGSCRTPTAPRPQRRTRRPLPRRRRRHRRSRDLERRGTRSAAAPRPTSPALPGIHLAAHTGMRRAEVAGLRWCDLDHATPSPRRFLAAPVHPDSRPDDLGRDPPRRRSLRVSGVGFAAAVQPD